MITESQEDNDIAGSQDYRVTGLQLPLDLIPPGAPPRQLEMFVERLPHRPYCADNLKEGLKIRLSRFALRRRYIQVNPPHLRFWMIHDIDRPGGAVAWDDAGLPYPAWSATNTENGHAHSAWGLSAPVLTGDSARIAPLRYLCAIESAYRERLGADEGFAGLITKNPIHPSWRMLWGPPSLYELGELADFIPDIEKHKPNKGKSVEIGLGRNCMLFDNVRLWSYKAIRRFDRRSGFVPWEKLVRDRANNCNADFMRPLMAGEVNHLVRSVSRWVWKRFTDKGFSAWQAAQGRRSGQARRKKSEPLRATARLLRAKGMTQVAIAVDLGVTERTVRNWLNTTGNEPYQITASSQGDLL